MKALPMLDHVMLWVARVFSAFLLLYLALVIWGAFTDYDSWLIAQHTGGVGRLYVSILLDASGLGLWFGTWTICTWLKPTIISRLILGLCAGFLAELFVNIIAVNSPLHTAIALGMRVTIQDFIVPGWIAAGVLSTAWLAFTGCKSHLLIQSVPQIRRFFVHS